MAIWPDELKPLADGYDNTPMENVHRNPAEAGKSAAWDLWGGATKFQATFEMLLSLADGRTLISFYRANRSTPVTFYDYDPSMLFENEVIGTGNGANLNFTIPAKTTTQLVYPAPLVEVANGSGGWTTQTAGLDYSISAGTGALGEDRVVFLAGHAPANGRQVRVTYTGRHRHTVDIVTCTWTTVRSTGRKRFRVRLVEAW